VYERKSEFDKNAFTVKFDYSPGLPAPGETASSAKSNNASLHRPFFKKRKRTVADFVGEILCWTTNEDKLCSRMICQTRTS
jgi:hypothetical protein